jgi:hypothetical protein
LTSLPEERFVLKEESPNQRIDKGLYFFSWEKTRRSSGYMIKKHVAFAPASQIMLLCEGWWMKKPFEG